MRLVKYFHPGSTWTEAQQAYRRQRDRKLERMDWLNKSWLIWLWYTHTWILTWKKASWELCRVATSKHVQFSGVQTRTNVRSWWRFRNIPTHLSHSDTFDAKSIETWLLEICVYYFCFCFYKNSSPNTELNETKPLCIVCGSLGKKEKKKFSVWVWQPYF